MGDRNFLGEFEELVLLAIMKIGSEAYGVTVLEAIQEATGKAVSTGALYTTFQRLEEKGFISSKMGEATAARGGRAKRYFQVENAGRAAIKNGLMARKYFISNLNFEF